MQNKNEGFLVQKAVGGGWGAEGVGGWGVPLKVLKYKVVPFLPEFPSQLVLVLFYLLLNVIKLNLFIISMNFNI